MKCFFNAAAVLIIACSPALAGDYIGRYSANPFGADSSANPFSRAGSPFSAESIGNPYGSGSPSDSDSPNNPYGEGLETTGD